MIPKIIHYCWFSGEAKPEFIQSCIQTWKDKCPEWEIREWGKDSFDFNSIPFVRDAYKAKKWAFVADYVRFYALYVYGGFYLDSDVKLLKPLDSSLLSYAFITSHEYYAQKYKLLAPTEVTGEGIPYHPDRLLECMAIQAAIMGAQAGTPYLKDVLDYYAGMSFYDETNEGKFINTERLVIGKHITKLLEKYGYRYVNKDQLLSENMRIFESSVFAPCLAQVTSASMAVHLGVGSWREGLLTNWKNRLKIKVPFVFSVISKLFGKS